MTRYPETSACPWCYGTDLWFWDKGVPGKFAVACSNPRCAATGPISDSRVDAVRNWNLAPRRNDRASGRLERVMDEMHPPEN